MFSAELYEQATNQSNYLAIFENQKEKLIEVFKGDLIYPYNGGYLLLGPQLFFEIKMYIDDDKTSIVLLDINYTPIEIKDLKKFSKETKSKYTEILNKYKIGLAKLKKSRNVSILTEVYELEDDVED